MATIVENNNNKNENTTIPLTKIQEEFFTAIENGDIKTVEKILSKIIHKYSGSIYPPSYNKIINLIQYILKNKFKGLTCGGCIVKSYKKNIIILREYSLINNIILTKQQN